MLKLNATTIDARFIAEDNGLSSSGARFEGLEILSPGVYKGWNCTPAYVEQLVANMQQLEKADGFQPAYVSGHTDEDEDWEQVVNDEDRVLGHWSNHRMVDGRYVADLVVYSPEVAREIETGKRRYRSAELAHSYQFKNGTVGPFMPICAGVVAPANTSAGTPLRAAVNLDSYPELKGTKSSKEGGVRMSIIERLRALFTSEDLSEEELESEVTLLLATDDVDSEEEDEEDSTEEEEHEEEEEEEKDKLRAELRKANTVVSKLETRLEAAEKQLQEQKEQARESHVEAQLSALVQDGYISPSLKESYRRQFMLAAASEETVKLSSGETVSTLDAFVEDLRSGTPSVRMGVETTHESSQDEAMEKRLDQAAESAGAKIKGGD